jgi:LCP family protein required for cell wall assembly
MKKTIIILLILSTLGFTSTTVSQTSIKSNLVELGIPEEKLTSADTSSQKQINIAFFGVDRRTTSDFGNSDLIMIASVDLESHRVSLSSIMRDTYVKIYARGKNKINAAYLEGGPKLAIRTLNENFDLDIKEYVSVDFFGSAKIIQALGGIEIDVKPEEIDFMNNYLGEIAGIDKSPARYITKPGLQLLDGKQAVAYTRIRGVGRGDYDRIERQKTVMSAVAAKFGDKGKEILPILIKDIYPNIETNLDFAKLFMIGNNLMQAEKRSVEHARFPSDRLSEGIRVDNIWYLSTDLKATTHSLHNFIYKGVKPE